MKCGYVRTHSVQVVISLIYLSDSNEDTGDARDFLDSLGIDSKKYSELDPSIVKIRAASRLKLGLFVNSCLIG